MVPPSDTAKNRLIERISQWRDERYHAQRRWSFAHHLVLFGSIIASVLAGTLIQINMTQHASLLTTLAAVLTAIAASGGFERKWKSNRLSRSRADRMLLALDDDEADLHDVRAQLAQAIEKHDMEVVGEKDDVDD
ncbi:MAG: hypothetical protein VB954_04130 [Thalassolituus sp.]|jgi:hypothetical protein|uniref:SMODS and SLOG-associating 2TM effector domain-containing protein n=2 Tax=root TaxID=1 RepID=M5E4U6_9GAMM|nr:hypothetical protein [Thalassolituus oleivorans]PCI49134.1 MAG: hypothetical protein COB43_06290 [Oceanospirillales bacterium]PHQ87890.1 MAG: hypothetical protein COB58_02310 [Thalassobium sp.]AHK17495.1 hypothetical protein R615_07250 [Thalassolituus oleivorans R6-15]APR66849.1 hypothetical protein CN03_07830 [Thalassolituus oleivorans]MCA6128913.1 hypothetical protein [Thalassolituus oleivorans 4BN06-13]|tara:strand:- start:69 stop:473 length:405 start_codon:yes stop_codon:yes gene_type:complete